MRIADLLAGRSIAHGALIMLLVTYPLLTCSAGWREVTEEIHVGIDELKPPIGRHNIDIQYQGGGDVTLRGYVQSEEARSKVERVAERSPGVSRVDNQLVIAKASSKQHRSVTQEMREAFEREVEEGQYDISILSRPDRIVLKGRVDSESTRQHVVSLAQSISKRRVDDELIVKPRRTDGDIEEAIRRTLEQEYPALIKNLEISVKAGVASLRGNLSSYREIDRVLATVLMVAGVSDIESEVSVRGARYPISAMARP